MTPREIIMAAATRLHEKSLKTEDIVADIDEETNLVTIYVNGSPRYTMHVSVYAELEAKFAAERHSDGEP